LKELASIQERRSRNWLSTARRLRRLLKALPRPRSPARPANMAQLREAAEQATAASRVAVLAKLFVGPFPYIVLIFVCALAGQGHFN